MIFNDKKNFSDLLDEIERARQTDPGMDERKLDTALKIIGVMRDIVSRDEEIELFIDFDGYEKSGKLILESGSRIKVRNFDHLWLKYSAKLKDGRRFVFQITQHIKRHEKNKVFYTKVKEKIIEKVVIAIDKPGKNENEIIASPRTESSKLPNGVSIKIKRCGGAVCEITAETPLTLVVHGMLRKSGDLKNMFTGAKLGGVMEIALKLLSA